MKVNFSLLTVHCKQIHLIFWIHDCQPEKHRLITASGSSLHDAFYSTELPHVGPDYFFEGFKMNSKREGKRIDYIFVNDTVKAKKHSILSVFKGDYYLCVHMPVFTEITLS